AACRGRSAANAEARTRPAAAPAPFALVAGTPAGGLRDWIGDVRRALRPLPATALRDASEAQKSALETYLTRQEYIEMYWGVTGKLTRGPELGAAVKEAETRFHLILAQLQPGHAPDAARLRAGIESLSEQYDRVLAAAAAARVPLDPHALAARGTETHR
ncbi:MAG TPA: hypothetical protein VF832_14700, partial [Longimicrobiales bacterium]